MPLFLVVIGVKIWSHQAWLVYAFYGLLVGIAITVLSKLLRLIRLHRYRALADIDAMSGLEFERYVTDLLKQYGFHNVALTEQYDLGVDIVAEKDGQRWGVQVKRHKGLVKAAQFDR